MPENPYQSPEAEVTANVPKVKLGSLLPSLWIGTCLGLLGAAAFLVYVEFFAPNGIKLRRLLGWSGDFGQGVVRIVMPSMFAGALLGLLMGMLGRYIRKLRAPNGGFAKSVVASRSASGPAEG